MTSKNIPEKIRAARKQKGMTQKQLGLSVGYTEASAESRVQYIEYGKRKIPLKDLRAFSETLGLDIDELIP